MSNAERLSLLAEKLKARGKDEKDGREPSRDSQYVRDSFDVSGATFSLDLQTHHIIVKPKSIQDVVACLQDASATGCSVSVVGGNHSGYGRTGDLVLEMSHFSWVQTLKERVQEAQKVVEVDAEQDSQMRQREIDGVAHVAALDALLCIGAGVTLKDVANEAEQRRLAVPLGTAPTVGLGLILQGGVGHLTRSLGLALDAIHSMQMVTAKAEVVNLSRDSPEPELKELFWAAVGCAPNFGVVTSVTLETAPFRHCDSFRQVFELENVDDSAKSSSLSFCCLQKYLSWSAELPVDCSADCCLYFKDDKTLERSSILMGIYTYDFGGVSPRLDLSGGPTLLLEKLLEKQGVAELMDQEPYLCEQPDGTVHRGFIPKRSFFIRALFFEKSADICKEVVEGMRSAPGRHCYFQFQHMGGVVSRRADSLFTARQAEWSLVISAAWSEEKSAAACRSWVMQVVQNLLPKALGSYATDLGPEDELLAGHSFGHNTSQLVQLKKKWDPENMFKHGFPLAALASREG
eukprot:s996_g17.t1